MRKTCDPIRTSAGLRDRRAPGLSPGRAASIAGFGLRAVVVVGGLAAILISGFVWTRRRHANELRIDLKSAARTPVVRGDMTISILQSGELVPKRSESINNESDRNAKIVYIIDDGQKVKKGDLLLELESDEVKSNVLKSQSEVSRAEAEVRAADEKIKIAALKQATDLGSARVKLEIAKLELKKYLDAEYPQKLDKANVEISLAQEELNQAKIKRDWTQKLVERGFANREELDINELEVKRREVELSNKDKDLVMLRDFSYAQDRKQKENDVATAQAEVQRLVKSFESEKARDEADLSAKKTSLEVAKQQLKRNQEQLDKTRSVSKVDGQYFYPKSLPWDSRKIEKGASVYPRQQLLNYPDLSAWNIKTAVPESIIDKIKAGMEGIAAIDALPDTILQARVERISAVPDRDSWFDSSTKSYSVILDIPTTPTAQLKPGMSVMVEIVTDRLKDAVYAPLQAITVREGKHFAYRIRGAAVETVEVKTGEQNEDSIQILEGLREGDSLLLYAPVESGTQAGVKERPLEKADKQKSSSRPAADKG